ncbi:acylneuraminate cytidylyltransferase family protein [Hyphobacterium sp.]|uniref:acylneuraminate cytidylyltransferase family protein n=1 Tax=Hyphobacterium sp. TaxID=2004662 RepID=UPI003B51E1C4
MVQSSKVVALLPMKAHSARVKSKNFREFAGKPLFRWILDTLLSVDEIDKVVINTDARQILSDHGLNDGDADGRVVLRDRKPEICGDLVSMNLVLADDVENVEADTYLMTHTTNPLLSAGAIRAALAKYREVTEQGAADSLFTVNRIQTRFYRDDMSPVNHDPDNLIRTQDLEAWFEENSNLYIFNRDSFARTQARIGAKPAMYETPPLESIDIDNADQWMLAEAVALYDRKVEL